MADVTINYGGQTIASLSDSGTKVLETSGTFLTDDITIDCVKSGGGGGVTKTVGLSLAPQNLIWVDGDGTAHAESDLPTWPTRVCLSGSLIVFATYNMLAPGEELAASNAQSVITIDNGSGASRRYTCVYQVD